jgi:NitT/TauT family transport system ATP-binding protein
MLSHQEPLAANTSTLLEFPVPVLSARDFGVTYEDQRSGALTEAVRQVDLDIAPGEFVSIVGLSGCGKSTFLSAVAGLVPYQTGSLRIAGKLVNGPGADRAVVFQKASLLPWRTVLENVYYGLELRGVPKKQCEEKGWEALELVGLKEFAHFHPRALSGGMQQRTNLARAIASDPEILLMDEPFAALDAITRETLQNELLDIWQRHRKTVLLVTHQIDEAVLLSDRVIVFSERPARIRRQFSIDLRRPRTEAAKSDPAFAHLVERIWAEVNRIGDRPEAEYAI